MLGRISNRRASRKANAVLPAIIIGGGGHAKVVAEALRLAGRDIAGFVALQRPPVLPDFGPWLGDDAALSRYRPQHVELVNGVGGTASTAARREIFERFHARGYRFAVVMHPAAVVASGVRIGEGAQIMAGAIVQPGARIGANVLLNTACSVDHDCDIGSHAHLAPGSVLCGGVGIGEGAHIGTVAAVIQGKTVGPRSVVAAGAVIVTDIPGGVLVMGVPARIVRPLSAGTDA